MHWTERNLLQVPEIRRRALCHRLTYRLLRNSGELNGIRLRAWIVGFGSAGSHRQQRWHDENAAGERGARRMRRVCFPEGGGMFTREALAKARHPFAMIRKTFGLQDMDVRLLSKSQ